MSLSDDLKLFGAGAVFEQRKLSRHLVYGERGISLQVLNTAKFDVLRGVVDEMVVSLQAYVWQEVIQDETATLTVDTPADWWQHFKRRWFPAWALKRWPARMRRDSQTYTFKTCALFPNFSYVAPQGGMGDHVIVTSMERKPSL